MSANYDAVSSMEMKALVEYIRVEAQISHCLLVVRKVSEDKVKQVDALLD